MASSRRLNLNCYHFFMAFSADTAFLGSSPERLYRRRDTALRTEALAGTVANHPEDHRAWQLGDWLMKDDKNQRENMLVVEDICQRLQGCTQTLDVLPPQVLRLRKVQHLRRCIWTELNQADDTLCLMQLQPLNASGMPVQRVIFLCAKASFVCHCVQRKLAQTWYACMPGQGLYVAQILSRNGKK